MNRRLFLKYLVIALLFCCTIDITIPEPVQEGGDVVQLAGVNGRQIKKGADFAKKGWKWIKGCSFRKPPIINTAEILVKGINEVRSQEEVLPKIGEYLSQTKPNEGGRKVINCVKTEANEIKMYLYEQGKYTPTKEKVIKIATESINLAEYDIRAMQEHYYIGYDGIEYVEFIIPKRAQYILNGQYSNRLYECMVFNVPKDINGQWKKFKAYLLAFIDDILNRPDKLWNEYMFRRGLAEINIDKRDVVEMERYLFAHIRKTDKEYDTKKFVHSKTA